MTNSVIGCNLFLFKQLTWNKAIYTNIQATYYICNIDCKIKTNYFCTRGSASQFLFHKAMFLAYNTPKWCNSTWCFSNGGYLKDNAYHHRPNNLKGLKNSNSLMDLYFLVDLYLVKYMKNFKILYSERTYWTGRRHTIP